MIDAQLVQRVFRDYDIRGLGGSEITPEFMRQLGRAFVAAFGVRAAVVGYDARPLSKAYLPFFVEGAAEQGADVCLVGLVPSEVVIAAAGSRGISHAAIITASHNSAEYVGIKLYRDTSIQISVVYDQDKLVAAMTRQELPPPSRRGQVSEHDPWPDYVKLIAAQLDGPQLAPRRVLADAGNGTGGLLLNHLAAILNLAVDGLFFEPDGAYPNHVPNPIVPRNRALATARAKRDNYDFSILFDGDADRIIFLDEHGDHIPSDFTGTLIADAYIQKKFPRSPVVSDLRRGWTLQDSAQARGYEAIITPAGNPYLKKAMRQSAAPYGFEASAHNIYSDFFYSDSSGMTLAIILTILASSGQSLSTLIAPYAAGHFMIDETNYINGDAAKVFAALESHFRDDITSHLDGLSFGTDVWHANLRPSNTEPTVRLNLEARAAHIRDEKFAEINALILAAGAASAPD